MLTGRRGPSGGPALTDVLGTCTSWGDGSCVVQPETGPPVVVAIADIVSGKPVPPRASVRHRVEPREAQLQATALFPDLATEPLGGWLLRRSDASPARRANSVLAFGPADCADAPAQVVAFYERSGRRPIAAVLRGSDEDELFRDRGWVPQSSDTDTVFALAGVAQASRRARAAPHGRTAEVTVAGGLAAAEVHEAGVSVASGLAAYDRDWVGFRGIQVSPGHRRQGLARVVMAALLEWGGEQGARTAYLQVLEDDTAARQLYADLGFTDHHAYRYLAEPR